MKKILKSIVPFLFTKIDSIIKKLLLTRDNKKMEKNSLCLQALKISKK